MGRVTAIFDDRSQAERAVTELRRIGVPDAQLSIVSRRFDEAEVTRDHDREHGDDAGSRIGKGALAGAGVGTLFGLAAALIPGIGPFITAGTLASVLGATGGAAVAGAIVGGTSGALAGMFAKAGYTREEAEFYAPAVERGGILVAVETDGAVPESQVRSVLAQFGGRTFGRDAALDRGAVRDELTGR